MDLWFRETIPRNNPEERSRREKSEPYTIGTL